MDAAASRVRGPSVARAWLVAHDARVVGAAMVVITLGLCLGSQWLLPVPGQPRKVPFWQLTPALLAMVASLATVTRLPAGAAAPQRIARGAWACCVIGVAMTCSWVVGLASRNLPSLVPGTVVAVALTFTAAVAVGRVSVWVGALLALVVLARVTTMAADDDLWASLPGSSQWVLAAVATTGVAAYALLGADGARMSRNGRGS